MPKPRRFESIPHGEVSALPGQVPDAVRFGVTAWAANQTLTPGDIDCVTAVMLKILDGKCKMGAAEKTVMAALYDALRGQPEERFGRAEHELIAVARQVADEALRNEIYERRVLAETAISRPVMKAFKAMIRARGLFAGLAMENEEEEA